MQRTSCFFLVIIMLGASISLAEPTPRGPMKPSRMLNRRNWVGKRVLSRNFQQQIGIQGDQAEKLKTELEALIAESQRLEEAIANESRRQGKLAKQVLSQPGANADNIMKIIERIGQYRTEQAKLATRQLIVIRDHLTEEQRLKAREILTAEARRRVQARMDERASREK